MTKAEISDNFPKLTAEALDAVRGKLLDLTLRNKLLNYSERSRTIRIIDELPNQIIDFLVDDRKELEFLPLKDSEQVPVSDEISIAKELPLPPDNEEIAAKHRDRFLQTKLSLTELEKRLNRVSAETQRALQETGANLLYLSIGFLQWKDKNSEKVCHAPLILIPVSLERKRIRRGQRVYYRYVLTYNEEDMSSNTCLQQKLLADWGLILPDLPEDPEEIDPEHYFAAVTEAISDFTDWLIGREMVLDLFSFSKLFMYLDLDRSNWPTNADISTHPILMDLLVGKEPPMLDVQTDIIDVDNDNECQDLLTVYDADSAQLTAIRDAMSGKNMVIEGPPGTGKSQTISNLIATAMGEGKTVLFLAEKMAALNVVKNRLEKVDLAPFVLELHSHKTNKRTLLEDIKKRVDHRYKKPKKLPDIRSEYKKTRQELNKYAHEMNQTFANTELTVHQIFWELETIRSNHPELKSVFLPDAKNWSPPEMDRRRAIISEIIDILNDKKPVTSYWYGLYLTELNAATVSNLEPVLHTFSNVLEIVDSSIKQISELTQAPISATYSKFRHIIDIDSTLLKNPPVLQEALLTNLTDKKKYDCIHDLCDQIQLIQNNRKQADKTLQGLSNVADLKLDNLANLLNEICNEKLSELSYIRLTELSTCLEKIMQQLNDLKIAVDHFSELPITCPKTWNDLKDLEPLLDFITNKTPIELELYINNQLFRDGIEELFQLASADYKEVAILENTVKKNCLLNQLGSLQDMQEIANVFKQYENHLVPILFKPYRTARCRFNNTVYKYKASDTREKIMDRILAYLEAKTEFESKQDYIQGFGLLFQGVKTNWSQIKRIIDWAAQYKKLIYNATLNKEFLSNFTDTLKRFTQLYDTVNSLEQSIPDLTQTLSSILGKSPKEHFFFDFSKDAPILAPLERIKESITKIKSIQILCDGHIVKPKTQLKKLLNTVALEQKTRKTIIGIKAAADRYQTIIGDIFQEESSNTVILLNHLGWIESLRQAGLSAGEINWLCHGNNVLNAKQLADCYDTIQKSNQQYTKAANAFKPFGYLDSSRFFLSSKGELTFTELQDKIHQCCQNLGQALGWGDYCRACSEAKELSLEPFIDAIDQGRIDITLGSESFILSCYTSLINDILDSVPFLDNFNREKHLIKQELVCEMSKQNQHLSTHLIIKKMKTNRPPSGVYYGPIKTLTEMGLLTHELSKQKRHLPIRALLSRAGKAIMKLKPCFMMSPLSVAQYLPPGKLEFDLLIMDEASQLRPEECLGAIARAKQVVIVGDSKQLPPTTFFDRISDEPAAEDEESALDNIESILDLFTQSYGGGRRLLWHYRSQHEDLIHFSNHNFYQNTLNTFPAAKNDVPSLGVSIRYIKNPNYHDQGNPNEASEIARAVLDHAKNDPNRSLGVGTFNSTQREIILHSIEDELATDPTAIPAFEKLSTGQEPFFVKNLENIQGDERDVIMISYTYGPDQKTGKLYQRFGPINGRGGWRRLNVMFTRARQQIIVFSSFRSDSLDIRSNTAKGAVMMKRYLDYAENRYLTTETNNRTSALSSFHRSVGNIITELGYDYDTNIGNGVCQIDIAVIDPRNPGEYILGILSDGHSYCNAGACNDRENLKHLVLSRLGWTLHVINSVDWFKHRQREIQRLKTLCTKAIL